MGVADQHLGDGSASKMMIKPEFQVDHHHKETRHPKAGDICPQCQSAKLDYDGLLNLGCVPCAYVLAGCFT